jgi:hypothetical protein
MIFITLESLQKMRNPNPFPVGSGMDRGMVEKFPISTDWLKGSSGTN